VEGRGFRDLKPEFDRLETQILGASFDDQAANKAFAAKFQFNFPLLCDTTRQIGLAYHACEAVDAQYAKRISYLIGPDGKIRKAYETVQPSQHPSQVLADIQGQVAAH